MLFVGYFPYLRLLINMMYSNIGTVFLYKGINRLQIKYSLSILESFKKDNSLSGHSSIRDPDFLLMSVCFVQQPFFWAHRTGQIV
jgi:hypothetical protein